MSLWVYHGTCTACTAWCTLLRNKNCLSSCTNAYSCLNVSPFITQANVHLSFLFSFILSQRLVHLQESESDFKIQFFLASRSRLGIFLNLNFAPLYIKFLLLFSDMIQDNDPALFSPGQCWICQEFPTWASHHWIVLGWLPLNNPLVQGLLASLKLDILC